MDLARQKQIINNKVFDFNTTIGQYTGNTIKAEWFVYDGDCWKITKSDGKVIANYLDFDAVDLVINALSFYLGD